MKNYVVRKGDSLYSISKRYYNIGFLWRFLVLINLKWKNPHELNEGEELRVPFIGLFRN
ncbi:LysM peptidoglycan-binding domain-containing protein [Cytobacillus sp. FJAT-54145]|uniref:LysM peptidoglycan-binding domain-containing protein n=1 Tax=Cytobacillus spartinae TaxID=3299023 RepID=A0ABW6KM46_9BACI